MRPTLCGRFFCCEFLLGLCGGLHASTRPSCAQVHLRLEVGMLLEVGGLNLARIIFPAGPGWKAKK